MLGMKYRGNSLAKPDSQPTVPLTRSKGSLSCVLEWLSKLSPDQNDGLLLIARLSDFYCTHLYR